MLAGALLLSLSPPGTHLNLSFLSSLKACKKKKEKRNSRSKIHAKCQVSTYPFCKFLGNMGTAMNKDKQGFCSRELTTQRAANGVT